MSKKEKARVHKDLDGLELNVDSFGEISSNMPIDKLNQFLNKNVKDKKLKDRDDLDDIKKD
ncbi:hypothetical protein [Ekhidna sp.]|uniref:hypothetical protein n=1 Tax=Ekhidna sp. TaxID=2608089 RepID=UPI003514AA63